MKKSYLLTALIVLSAGCSVVNTTNSNLDVKNKNMEIIFKNTQIIGQVNYPENFNTKSNQDNISKKSTVSIIIPADKVNANTTVAVGLTDENGRFKINPNSDFSPQDGDIYILEASKRLGGENNYVLTLKTFIKWTSLGWTSITGGNVYINTKTTALAILSGYNSSLLTPNETISKLTVVANKVISIDINASIKIKDIEDANLLVISALNDSKDPTEKINYINNKLDYVSDESAIFNGK